MSESHGTLDTLVHFAAKEKASATVMNDKPLDKKLFIRKAINTRATKNEFNLISRSCIIFSKARG